MKRVLLVYIIITYGYCGHFPTEQTSCAKSSYEPFLEPEEGIRVPDLPLLNNICKRYVLKIESITEPNKISIAQETSQFHMKRNHRSFGYLTQELKKLIESKNFTEGIEKVEFTDNKAPLNDEENISHSMLSAPEPSLHSIQLTVTPSTYEIFKKIFNSAVKKD